MSNIFDYTDYRDFLKKLLTRYTQTQLAKSMQCQATYLSQVFKEKAALTEDHGIKLCQYVEFNESETEYFLILLRLSRSGTPTLREYLEQKRLKLLEQNTELNERLSADKKVGVDELNIFYCSSWIPRVLHSATSCERYQTISALAQRFGLSKEVVEYYLHNLEKFKLVRFEKNKWIYNGGSLHFPKASPLDQSFQLSQRLHAMNKLSQRQSTNMHYSSVLSISKETALVIRQLLISQVDEIHKLSEPSASEDVYSICLDFYNA